MPKLIQQLAPIISAGAAAATFVLLSPIVGPVFAAMASAVVAGGVGYGLAKMFPAKMGGSARAQDRKQTIRSSTAPRQIVYGTARVSGPIVYASSSGGAKEFLHLIIPLAGHRVSSPLALWINDERIPFSDIDPTTSLVTTGKYANRVRFQFFAGDQTTACSAKDETTDGWSADHILRETAYMYLRLEYDREAFGNGPGAISCELQGHVQILDPRTSTTGFSNNPALCILHYLTSADGLACSADEIDTASFISAANICDELVTISAGGATQRRYTLDGAFDLEQKPIDIIEDMLTSCAGTLVYVQGKYRLYAGTYDAPTDTLTTTDLAGSIELVTKPPRRELFNTVRGTFINPSRNWQASEFPAYSETAIVTADGETITTDVEWPFTTDEIRAQRLAKLTLRRAREALTVRVPVKYAGLRYCVWQTLNVTLADFGWTNKPFRIVAWTFDAESGIINLTLREESANSYAWQFGDASPLPLAPDTNLVDPLAIPAPTAVAVTASTVLQTDGSVAPALLVTWTASAFAFLIGHEVQWRVTGATDWNSAEVPFGTNRFVIAPVVIGTSYQVRVRGVTGIARGAWSGTSSGTGAADTTAPSAPTGLAATGITRGISVTWTLPTSTPDLAAIEVHENTSSSTAGRAFIGETLATGFVRTGLAPAEARWFWARSRDRSGNVSAFVGPVSATATLLATDDFPAAVRPIERVTSLPTGLGSADEGRTVYLTTDDLLYRWTGTQWVQVGGTADVGFLNENNFPATLRPIQRVSALPTGLTSAEEGRVVFLTTDDKLYRWTGSAWTRATDGADLTPTSVTADKIEVGSLTAAQIQTNSITADRMAFGIGGNVVWNGTFVRTTAGWWAERYGASGTLGFVAAISPWALRGFGSGSISVSGTVSAGQGARASWSPHGVATSGSDPTPTVATRGIPGAAGKRYGASALLLPRSCEGRVEIVFRNSSGTVLSTVTGATTVSASAASDGQTEDRYTLNSVIADAPANTASVEMRVDLRGTGASGPELLFTKCQLAEIPATASVMPAWSPGGVTIVDGGHIRAESITATEIVSESVTATRTTIYPNFHGAIGTWHAVAALSVPCTLGSRRTIIGSAGSTDESAEGVGNGAGADYLVQMRVTVASVAITAPSETVSVGGSTSQISLFNLDTASRSGDVVFVLECRALDASPRTNTGFRAPSLVILEHRR